MITVIIPLYNKEKYIKRSLNSVYKQSIDDYEIIVVDDGSTDKGASIVEIEGNKKTRLIKQENAGVSAARNTGIRESQGDLITFLDADDEWESSFLTSICRLSEKFPEAGAYTTAIDVVEDNGMKRKQRYAHIPSHPWEGLIPNYFESARAGTPPIYSSTVGVPRSVFDELGVFPEGEPIGEDLDMWGRIAMKYPIAFSWDVGATYFKNADNRSCKSYITRKNLPFVESARNAIKEGRVPIDLIPSVEEYIARIQIDSVKQNLASNQQKYAFAILRDCKTQIFKKEVAILKLLTCMPNSSFLLATLANIKRIFKRNTNYADVCR